MTGDQRRCAIVIFLRDYIREYGYSPTTREIGDAVGLTSPASVHAHLVVMQRDGLITFRAFQARTIRLAEALAA